MSTTAESVTLNTRSMASALRDFATLLEAGDAAFVAEGLRSLAARVEEMARDQVAEAPKRAECLEETLREAVRLIAPHENRRATREGQDFLINARRVLTDG